MVCQFQAQVLRNPAYLFAPLPSPYEHFWLVCWRRDTWSEPRHPSGVAKASLDQPSTSNPWAGWTSWWMSPARSAVLSRQAPSASRCLCGKHLLLCATEVLWCLLRSIRTLDNWYSSLPTRNASISWTLLWVREKLLLWWKVVRFGVDF